MAGILRMRLDSEQDPEENGKLSKDLEWKDFIKINFLPGRGGSGC